MAKDGFSESSSAATAVVAKEPAFKEGFYWLGLLPASGAVELPAPTIEPPHVKAVKATAYDMWMNGGGLGKPGDEISIFVSKLRQYTGVAVDGWNFSGVSNAPQVEGGNIAKFPYPGQVQWLTPRKAERIVRSCFQNFAVFPFGVDRANEIPQKVEIRSLNDGKRPDGMSDLEWTRFSANGQVEVVRFDPRTCKFIAEFVYVHYLGDSRTGIDEADYLKNPNKYHARMVPAMNAEFFRNPPKSVVETYPKYAAA